MDGIMLCETSVSEETYTEITKVENRVTTRLTQLDNGVRRNIGKCFCSINNNQNINGYVSFLALEIRPEFGPHPYLAVALST